MTEREELQDQNKADLCITGTLPQVVIERIIDAIQRYGEDLNRDDSTPGVITFRGLSIEFAKHLAKWVEHDREARNPKIEIRTKEKKTGAEREITFNFDEYPGSPKTRVELDHLARDFAKELEGTLVKVDLGMGEIVIRTSASEGKTEMIIRFLEMKYEKEYRHTLGAMRHDFRAKARSVLGQSDQSNDSSISTSTPGAAALEQSIFGHPIHGWLRSPSGETPATREVSRPNHGVGRPDSRDPISEPTYRPYRGAESPGAIHEQQEISSLDKEMVLTFKKKEGSDRLRNTFVTMFIDFVRTTNGKPINDDFENGEIIISFRGGHERTEKIKAEIIRQHNILYKNLFPEMKIAIRRKNQSTSRQSEVRAGDFGRDANVRNLVETVMEKRPPVKEVGKDARGEKDWGKNARRQDGRTPKGKNVIFSGEEDD